VFFLRFVSCQKLAEDSRFDSMVFGIADRGEKSALRAADRALGVDYLAGVAF